MVTSQTPRSTDSNPLRYRRAGDTAPADYRSGNWSTSELPELKPKTPLLHSLVGGTAALVMILVLGGCGSGLDLGAQATSAPGPHSTGYPAGTAPEKVAPRSSGHTVAVRSRPEPGAPVIAEVDDPDCSTISAHLEIITATHTDAHDQKWFRTAQGWIHNDGFCI